MCIAHDGLEELLEIHKYFHILLALAKKNHNFDNMKALSQFILLVVILLAATGQAQNLQFNRNREFKIVQFTDLHYKLHNPASQVVPECISEIVKAEKPDLIIVTGDFVYSRPADSTLTAVLNIIEAQNTPFIMLFGNHDSERGMTNGELQRIIATYKHNVITAPYDSITPDHVITVKDHSGSRDAALLYCFDTHANAQIKEVGGYAWLTGEQVQWYSSQSASFTRSNGGVPLPALAFMHIPLPEYAEAATMQDAILIGTRMEAVCCPKINTGMFAAMRISGDVMGIFSGHDHDNDYATMWHGILLAYGRFTGGNTEYNHLPSGARVIVLKEGQRSFETWIRLRGGQTQDHTVYPTSYIKDNWRLRK